MRGPDGKQRYFSFPSPTTLNFILLSFLMLPLFSKSNLCIFVAFVMIPDCESGAVTTCSTFYPCCSSPRITHHVQHCLTKRSVCWCVSYLQAFLMSHASNKCHKCECKMIRELCSCSHMVLIFSCWQESSSSAASFWEPHADFNRRDIESSSTAWLCFHWLNVSPPPEPQQTVPVRTSLFPDYYTHNTQTHIHTSVNSPATHTVSVSYSMCITHCLSVCVCVCDSLIVYYR